MVPFSYFVPFYHYSEILKSRNGFLYFQKPFVVFGLKFEFRPTLGYFVTGR